MPKKVLITAALPYANGPLHFGHIAGAYLPADCYARYQRLKGADVVFICGSDEHGVAITLSAQLAKRTPKEHVDIYHNVIKNFFKQLNMSFDHYSRTTWEGHAETTKEFFQDLLQNGYIEAKVTDQLFSEADQQFLADRYVVGTCPKCGYEEARGDECQSCGASYEAIDLRNPRSKLTNSPLIKKPTKHWFLKFDMFKEQLKKWLEDKQWKNNVFSFASHYIDDLKERAITRDSDWGIPVPLPDAEGKVFYVWFDAPIGYISATKEWAELQGEKEKWKDYWLDQQTTLVQFIGKDNIPFHAIFFPAMVMGQNTPYILVQDLPANEFYKLEGKQFSKSSGWYIDLDRFFKKFSADQIRYAIAANAPETSDSEFLWKDFQQRCNAELLGKYANFANRVLTFINSKMDQKVPSSEHLLEKDLAFLEKCKNLVNELAVSYSSYHLRKAASQIMELASYGNAYFDHEKPWVLVKNPMERHRLESVLYTCLCCLEMLSIVSYPIVPNMAGELWELLGHQNISDQNWDIINQERPKPGIALPKPFRLVEKVEDNDIQEEIDFLMQTDTQQTKSDDLITFDDFLKVKMRVGQIIEAKKVEKSNKLLHLTVDFGDEKRSIVSGIAKHYSPEEVVGKKAVFVVNLKPAKLMGIESQGMLLCASDDQMLEIPQIDSMAVGVEVS